MNHQGASLTVLAVKDGTAPALPNNAPAKRATRPAGVKLVLPQGTLEQLRESKRSATGRVTSIWNEGPHPRHLVTRRNRAAKGVDGRNFEGGLSQSTLPGFPAMPSR